MGSIDIDGTCYEIMYGPATSLQQIGKYIAQDLHSGKDDNNILYHHVPKYIILKEKI